MWLAAAAYIYKGINFLFFGKDKISFLFFRNSGEKEREGKKILFSP